MLWSFSDYGKGGLTHISEMIRLARAAGGLLLVDPKGDDYSSYAGAAMHYPESKKRDAGSRWAMEEDDADLARKAEALRAGLALEALLVTRSEG